MDFQKIVPLIIGEFKKSRIRYSLIGGFAMGALGIVRSTVDLDFLVDREDMEKVSAIMKKYDYRCMFKNENVSQYVSNIKIFGEMDFLHAFRPVSRGMLRHSKTVSVLGRKTMVKVVRPEDIIGLKVQAAANDQTRQTKEYADIETIMAHYRGKLDWHLIEDYFELFAEKDALKRLRGLYGAVDQTG